MGPNVQHSVHMNTAVLCMSVDHTLLGVLTVQYSYCNPYSLSHGPDVDLQKIISGDYRQHSLPSARMLPEPIGFK